MSFDVALSPVLSARPIVSGEPVSKAKAASEDSSAAARTNPFAGVSGPAVVRKSEPGSDVRARLGTFASRGLGAAVSLGRGVVATTTRTMSDREIAAAAYGIAVRQVGVAHLDALAAANPTLVGRTTFPPATTVTLNFTRRGIETYASALVAAREVVRAERAVQNEGAAKLLDAYEAQLTAELHHVHQVRGRIAVGAEITKAHREAASAESPESIARSFAVAYERANRSPDLRRFVQAEYARALVGFADTQLAVGGAGAAESAYVGAIAALDDLGVVAPASLHVAAARAAQAKGTFGDRGAVYDRYTTASAIDGFDRTVDRALALADLAARGGEPKLAAYHLRKALRAQMAEPIGWLPVDTRTEPDVVRARIAGSSIAARGSVERTRTVGIALSLAEHLSARGLNDHAGALVRMVEAVDHEAGLLPEQKLSLTAQQGYRALAEGDASEAAQLFENVRRGAANARGMSDGRRLALVESAMHAEVMALVAVAADDPSRRSEALRRIAALRTGARDANLSGATQAGLAILEMNAALESNESARAEQIFRTLKAEHAADPTVKRALATMETKRVGGAEAFVKVLINEAASTSMKDVAMVTGAGAVVGAVVGFAFFGAGAAPGAAVGAAAATTLFVGAAGTALLLGRNLIRGADRIAQAGRTGLAAQTWGQAAMDVGAIALDVVSAYAPVKGIGSLGRGGARAMILGARGGAEAKAVLAGLRSQVARTGGAGLSVVQIESLSREMLMHRFAKNTIDFGGAKVAAAGLGMIASGVASSIHAIESNPQLGAVEKSRAYEQLAKQLGASLLQLGALAGAGAVVNHVALRPMGGQRALRASLREVAMSRPTMRIVDADAYAARLDRLGMEMTPESLLVARRASAFTDPVTGETMIRRGSSAAMRRDAAHELVHERFHQLAAGARTAVVDSFVTSTSWDQIDARLVALHPDLAGASDAVKVSELLAMLHAEPAAQTALARISRPLLSSPAVRRARLSKTPALDVDRLLATGTLETSARPYRPTTAERDVAASHLLLVEDGAVVDAAADATRSLDVTGAVDGANVAEALRYAKDSSLTSMTFESSGAVATRADASAPWTTTNRALAAVDPRIALVVEAPAMAKDVVARVAAARDAGASVVLRDASGATVASVTRTGSGVAIEIDARVAKDGKVRKDVVLLARDAMTDAAVSRVVIGAATITRGADGLVFSSTASLDRGVVRDVFRDYLVQSRPVPGVPADRLRATYDSALSHATTVPAKTKAGEATSAAAYTQARTWWKNWERGGDALGRFANSQAGQERLVGLIDRVDAYSEPVGLRLGGLAKTAHGQNTFALMQVAADGEKDLARVVHDGSKFLGARADGEVRGAVLDMSANRWLGTDTRPGRHEWAVFVVELDRLKDSSTALEFRMSVLPEDATQGAARTKTPDFVIETAPNTYVVVDAKHYSVRNASQLITRVSEIAKGMLQVNAAAFLPVGAKRTGRLMIGVVSDSSDGAVVRAAADAARAARDRVDIPKGVDWIDVDIEIYRSGERHPLARLSPDREYRP